MQIPLGYAPGVDVALSSKVNTDVLVTIGQGTGGVPDVNVSVIFPT